MKAAGMLSRLVNKSVQWKKMGLEDLPQENFFRYVLSRKLEKPCKSCFAMVLINGLNMVSIQYINCCCGLQLSLCVSMAGAFQSALISDSKM